MNRRHLPHEAGGNPARGPAREMANEPASPRDLDDFPDVPEANAPGASSGNETPDQPDLDAFADRLGLRDEPSGPGKSERSPATARVTNITVRAVGMSRSMLATCLAAVSKTSGRLADRVRADDA